MIWVKGAFLVCKRNYVVWCTVQYPVENGYFYAFSKVFLDFWAGRVYYLCSVYEYNVIHYTTWLENIRSKKLKKVKESEEKMSENNELKPKSFRITTETHEKFKEIANSIGGNQQLALERLIQVYEMEQGKAVLPEKAESIEKFEQYATKLVSMYIESMEHQQNQAELIREEFKRKLESQQNIIEKLQKDLEEAEFSEKLARDSRRELEEENTRLNKSLKQMESQQKTDVENMQQIIVEKENLNRALTDNCNSLKEKVEQMQEETDGMADLKKQLADLQAQLARKEFEHEKELLEIERKHSEELMKQSQKHMEDIREYQSLFFRQAKNEEAE